MKKLRLILLLLTRLASTISQIPMRCDAVQNLCKQSNLSWTRCYEANINRCIRGRILPTFNEDLLDFYQSQVDTNTDFQHMSRTGHAIYLSSEALMKSTGPHRFVNRTEMAVTLFSSSFFSAVAKVSGNETIIGGTVLGVKAGTEAVKNVSQAVRISFNSINETGAICVFYEELEDGSGTGRWSTEGCAVSRTNKTIVCSCDHLSFFALLVNTDVSIDSRNASALSWISYIGCGLSVFFTAISILMHLCLRKGRSDQSMTVHMNLTGALFLLHLSFLLSVLWAGQALGQSDFWGGAICPALGLLLHFSLLATFTWMAIEGFHLYLLLVQVFNIYIKRYLLKLGLVGWGFPVVTVTACAIIHAYGKFCLQTDRKGRSPTGSSVDICWIREPNVRYITVTGFLGLVFLFSAVMLAVMVAKLRKVRTKNIHYLEHKRRMWRDCLTILGMGCVLGVPWGLAFITYGPLTLADLYLFTILNGFQGVFMFLWLLALTWRPCKEEISAVNDTSTQKMETSFNN
ncbi:hypothetical protein GJAV_G00245490 [Gymnothorax javanicus]|nr:hypothetical protein GJAV_G00245490 [Gymnothorax javanicus]